MTSNSEDNREMFRHIAASLAYRATKTIREVPDTFATFRVDTKSRAPVEILAHMSDLFDWALSMLKGKEIWHDSNPQDWNREVARFCDSLQKFDTYLASNSPIACPLDKLFQGPIADAFTHVGQLAMLRRLSGAPIRGENYFKADIIIGKVGLEQSKPRKEFD
ncbi:MAG: hypothetical protein ABSC53_13140 [Bacteroidota bacterium]